MMCETTGLDIIIVWDEEVNEYAALCEDLPGLVGAGGTKEEALEAFKNFLPDWLLLDRKRHMERAGLLKREVERLRQLVEDGFEEGNMLGGANMYDAERGASSSTFAEQWAGSRTKAELDKDGRDG